MRSSLRWTLATVLAAQMALTAFASGAHAGDARGNARLVVQDLLGNAETVMHDHGPSELAGAITPYFAFDLWGRFLLQPREKAFSAEQRRVFRDLLPGFMAQLYHVQFHDGLNSPPEVGEARKVRRDIMVGTVFEKKNGRRLPVDWRLRRTKKRNVQVIDIMVGGTSFMLQKRDEFTAMIDRGGPDTLLNYMRQNSY